MCASAVRLLFISVLYNKKGDPSFEESPFYSGKTGIRTLGTVARSPHFECGPIDHSGIFPYYCGTKVEKNLVPYANGSLFFAVNGSIV